MFDDDHESDLFLEVHLEDFTIYRAHRARSNKSGSVIEGTQSNEMVSLHEINEPNVQHFFFDGVLCHEGKKRYLQQVPFSILSVGGYEDATRSSVEADVWMQSIASKNMDVWYRLGSPSFEYRQYHWTFLWIANLGKHVVDYLHIHEQICLNSFRGSFYDWLRSIHSQDADVEAWFGCYGDRDFRRMVASQANYLFCQAVQVDESYRKHPLWAEIHPWDLCAVPTQTEDLRTPDYFATSKEAGNMITRRKTTVTPYVFRCFQYLPWAKFLYSQAAVPATKTGSPTESLLSNIFLTDNWRLTRSDPSMVQVSIGDVVAIPSDAFSTWKHQGAEWYAYVQSVTCTNKGSKLGLLWLYRPSDTACMKMSYPYAQELFLSDHCNCDDSPVYADEVIRKPCVAFFGQPETSRGEFFCRQQYLEVDSAWITLRPSHFQCRCRQPQARCKYVVGDTVLIASHRSHRKTALEPVVISQINPDQKGKSIKVRKLLRKHRDCGVQGAPPNELVYTDRFDMINPKTITRRCSVRFYTAQEVGQNGVPIPYNRQGMADCYFIASQEQDRVLLPLRPPWPFDVNQGWDPTVQHSSPPLRGLDIFCGGGNFGRGLEEGGAVSFEWAVDHCNEAIHTYRANLGNTNKTKLFSGSVNQYLSEALKGNKHGGLVAQKGEVDVIIAGSPCQGFSLANPNKGNDRGLFNESMVASVIGFIDFYRPKYAFLENVKGMATGGQDRNVLAAVTCALVGIGYQVRTFALDAWSFGSAQSRSRISITVTAPGLMPIPEPPQTHNHPENVMGGSLGKTANGLHTSARYVMPTPFSFVSAVEATKDLPSTEARLYCVKYPDHRMSVNMSTSNRVCASCIPRFPGGSGYLAAHARGFMPQTQVDNYMWGNQIRAGRASKAWSRIKRTKLMPTIMTSPRPDDGVSGNCLHWDDHRLITILEARRAQGFPDHEVILGSIADQWKIIGNSVARPVALALGMSLRESWLTNDLLDEEVADYGKQQIDKLHAQASILQAEEQLVNTLDTNSVKIPQFNPQTERALRRYD